jgi:Rieske Fe-S protein
VTSRRSALKALVLGLLAACESTVARLRGRTVTALATVGQVPPGGAYRLTRGDDPLILVNAGGEIRGFHAVCTHEGCPLGWNAQQHLIRCPCHGSAFDTRGRVVEGPAPRPLTALETIVERGQVYLVQRSSDSANSRSPR